MMNGFSKISRSNLAGLSRTPAESGANTVKVVTAPMLNRITTKGITMAATSEPSEPNMLLISGIPISTRLLRKVEWMQAPHRTRSRINTGQISTGQQLDRQHRQYAEQHQPAVELLQQLGIVHLPKQAEGDQQLEAEVGGLIGRSAGPPPHAVPADSQETPSTNSGRTLLRLNKISSKGNIPSRFLRRTVPNSTAGTAQRPGAGQFFQRKNFQNNGRR